MGKKLIELRNRIEWDQKWNTILLLTPPTRYGILIERQGADAPKQAAMQAKRKTEWNNAWLERAKVLRWDSVADETSNEVRKRKQQLTFTSQSAKIKNRHSNATKKIMVFEN